MVWLSALFSRTPTGWAHEGQTTPVRVGFAGIWDRFRLVLVPEVRLSSNGKKCRSTRFARVFTSFDWGRGWTSRESDLAETRFDLRLHTSSLCDDAVERGGLFLEFSGVVVVRGHGSDDDTDFSN